jgi:hypothetical protein
MRTAIVCKAVGLALGQGATAPLVVKRVPSYEKVRLLIRGHWDWVQYPREARLVNPPAAGIFPWWGKFSGNPSRL